jgi:hypothetical protein
MVELPSAGDPAEAVRGEASAGNNQVQMRMIVAGVSIGGQHETDSVAKGYRLGRHRTSLSPNLLFPAVSRTATS